jgi:hypothetical protein
MKNKEKRTETISNKGKEKQQEKELLRRTDRLLPFHLTLISDTTSRKKSLVCKYTEVNKTKNLRGGLQFWYY